MATRNNTIQSKGIRFDILCIAAAMLTYMSMYAFRKPLAAATFEGLNYWGIDYKIIAIISQVIGYTCSKFIGIRVVSGMKHSVRIKYILGLIGTAWVALFFFALTPPPYNVAFLVINGLPLGMIFGIVISFLEGRHNTELISAGLCSSFIMASGVTKSVGQLLIKRFGISDFWMPFLVGLIFVPLLLIGVYLLSLIPPQSADDESRRSERKPMGKAERRAFLQQFTGGVVLATLIYAMLMLYRDLRDNFAVEIWDALGYGDNVGILAYTETAIAFAVLIMVACMIHVVNNHKAFYTNFIAFFLSGFLFITLTWLFRKGMVHPAVWMMGTGFALYLPFACFHAMFYERWIALFRVTGNIAFLITIADAFGYLSSVSVMLYKNFANYQMDWLHFLEIMAFIIGSIVVVASACMLVYFRHKERQMVPQK